MKKRIIAWMLALVLSLSCLSVFGSVTLKGEFPDPVPGAAYDGMVELEIHGYSDPVLSGVSGNNLPDWMEIEGGWYGGGISSGSAKTILRIKTKDDKVVPADFQGISINVRLEIEGSDRYGVEALTVTLGDDKANILTPQVNAPDDRIVIEPEEVEDDALRFALYRTRRNLAEKADVPFRIYETDMSLYGEPVKHEQLTWSSSDETIATVDPVTGWVKLTGKAGNCYIIAEYTDAYGTHTAKYKVMAY